MKAINNQNKKSGHFNMSNSTINILVGAYGTYLSGTFRADSHLITCAR